MATTCKNCATTFDGNYCNNCGQSADTHAINWHYVWHDIQHGIFHVDKGLFYTLKELYTRPGATIREFIDGKRIRHFKPIAMVFLLATFYGFIYHYLEINLFRSPGMMADKSAAAIYKAYNNWVGSHYALTTLLYIPFNAYASYLVFRKSNYNFIEHIVLNSFIAGQKLIVQFLFLPLFYFFSNQIIFNSLLTLSLIIDILLTIWVYRQFFNMYSKTGSFLRTIGSYLLSFTFASIAGGLVIAGIWLSMR